ncbi:MAG: hypothetical protein Q8P18_26145 [Pseudomonadota bacterium]|nr:hypothetical protein [Pseudomonadota bacterium]
MIDAPRPARPWGWLATLMSLGALPLSACEREVYDVADLQLDVAALLPADAEVIRVCVSDHGTLERGAGNGRVPFPGLRAGESILVSLDIYNADGALIASAGPAPLDAAAPYATTPLLDPGAPCVANGALAREDADSWLLALRFEE